MLNLKNIKFSALLLTALNTFNLEASNQNRYPGFEIIEQLEQYGKNAIVANQISASDEKEKEKIRTIRENAIQSEINFIRYYMTAINYLVINRYNHNISECCMSTRINLENLIKIINSKKSGSYNFTGSKQRHQENLNILNDWYRFTEIAQRAGYSGEYSLLNLNAKCNNLINQLTILKNNLQ